MNHRAKTSDDWSLKKNPKLPHFMVFWSDFCPVWNPCQCGEFGAGVSDLSQSGSHWPQIGRVRDFWRSESSTFWLDELNLGPTLGANLIWRGWLDERFLWNQWKTKRLQTPTSWCNLLSVTFLFFLYLYLSCSDTDMYFYFISEKDIGERLFKTYLSK